MNCKIITDVKQDKANKERAAEASGIKIYGEKRIKKAKAKG